MLRRPNRSVLDGRSLHLGAVVADDGVWQLARGRVGVDGTAVTIRRPVRPSAAAAGLLVAEHDLLARLGGGVIAEPVALVAPTPDSPPTALALRPAIATTVGRSGPLAVGHVVAVVASAAEGLARLHAAGVVHTDLDAEALGVDDDGAVVLVSVARARRRRRSADDDAAHDVLALGHLGLALLGSSHGESAEREAVAAVLARLVDPDPLRRPDARTALEVLRRTGPAPRPVPVPTPPPADTVGRRGSGESGVGRAVGEAVGVARSGDDDPEGRGRVGDLAVAVPRRRPAVATRRPAAATAALACLASVLVALGVSRLTADGVAAPAGVVGPSGPSSAAQTGHARRACPVSGSPAPAADAVTVQADVDGRGCTVAVVWSPSLGEVAVATPEGVRRYGLGQPGDELVVADWDCDGAATPLLRRPTTAEAWRFDRWPTDERPVEAAPVPVDLPPPTC